jgi:hypothetical protein
LKINTNEDKNIKFLLLLYNKKYCYNKKNYIFSSERKELGYINKVLGRVLKFSEVPMPYYNYPPLICTHPKYKKNKKTRKRPLIIPFYSYISLKFILSSILLVFLPSSLSS